MWFLIRIYSWFVGESSVNLPWKTVICGDNAIKTRRPQSRKWGFSHRFYAALAFAVGNRRQISGENAVCGGDSACITEKRLARWGNHPKKTKKPPSKDETLRRTATATRGPTQDCAKSATQAQKSRPPLTLRLRAALTEARTTDSGAISIRPHATASHLSRLSESYPSGLSPSMPFAMILA